MTHPTPKETTPSPWLRALILCAALLGINYLLWRWTASVNWSAWWIAVPLVLAETYSLIDSLLFGVTIWRLRRRPAPPPASADATVDVLITSDGQPVEVVMATAEAAQRIRFSHQTYILDSEGRRELSAAAAGKDIRYIARWQNWQDDPQNFEAGGLDRALLKTDGEFFLVLNAGQCPEPRILDRTLGYFNDPRVALVQMPQHVRQAPRPGSQADGTARLYDPIEEGRDGWNAVSPGETNVVLRREALMQLGVSEYVRAVEERVSRTVYTADKIIRHAKKAAGQGDSVVNSALDGVDLAIANAWRALDRRLPIADITYRFQQEVDLASRRLVEADVTAMRADLDAIAALGGGAEPLRTTVMFDDATLAVLASRDWSPLGALESISEMIRAVDVAPEDYSTPMLPMISHSVSGNLSISMQLHARGWTSVYHPEVLASVVAPIDVGTMLARRTHEAQGTIQAVLQSNPLTYRGLSAGQRLMYFSAVWRYFAGFAALAYLAAPAAFLVFNVMPVQSYDWALFGRLIPFLVLNQLLLFVVSRGNSMRRERWYRLALFPVWINACVTALWHVRFSRPRGSAVTPQISSERPDSTPWGMFRWQFVAMAALATATVVGIVRLHFAAWSELGLGVNLIWAVVDVAILSVVFQAIRHHG